MLELTREGKLPEAENDAIALTNLLDKVKELDEVLEKINN